MSSKNININHRVPAKISCVGSNYGKSKDFNAKELLQIVEFDLNRLAKEYSEIGAEFRLSVGNDDQLLLKVLFKSRNMQAFNILSDEIEHILWSYNKQILTHSRGEFVSRYLRFNYVIEFHHEEEAAEP